MYGKTVESEDISISGVFNDFYIVPDYQREYVWESEQVEQLLFDINAEISGIDPHNAPEYFIGSIVVCPRDHGILELIDGQQRMTSLFLTLCAVRDRLRELGDSPPDTLDRLIAAVTTDAAGTDHFRYRLDLQYEDSGDVLVRLADGKNAQSSRASTRSTVNIENAYKVNMEFLRQEFGEDPSAVRKFYGYLTNRVKMIRISTGNLASALKIFETINDRGVGLDSMDLLKNLLFMKADQKEFEALKKMWKRLQDTIFEMNEKPLRFLRYFILSQYDVDVLREDEIYGWLSKHEDTCGYGKAPREFVQSLIDAAQAYRRFFNGYDVEGNKNRYLENLRLLGGKAARQHLVLLLSGRKLSAKDFSRLAEEVEGLFFVYVVTREPTREFERKFAQWATEVRRIKGSDDLENFFERRIEPEKGELSTRFDDSLKRLYSGSVQKYRLMYILGKIAQYIDIKGYGETEATRWLSRYTRGGFEIEHVFPVDPSPEAAEEFGECEDTQIAGRLGNLVLVEKSINASLGNKPYSEKKEIYRQSQLLFARALPERPEIGRNTSIDKAVAHIEPFPEWNEATVLARQNQLAELAKRVWDVPVAGGR